MLFNPIYVLFENMSVGRQNKQSNHDSPARKYDAQALHKKDRTYKRGCCKNKLI